MARLDSIDLQLLDCRGLDGPADACAVLELVGSLGFVLAEQLPNSFTQTGETIFPEAADIPEFVTKKTGFAATLRLPSQRGKPLRKGDMISAWGLFALRPEMPKAVAHLQVRHIHPDRWEVGMVLDPIQHRFVNRSVEGFCDEWGHVLGVIGDALYERCQPAYQYLLANGAPGLQRAAARQLIVGWRTWYGPEHVSEIGRDLLLGLPGRTRALPDGGVAHQLAAPLLDVVRGRWKSYEPVLAYLEANQIAAFWPKPRKVPGDKGAEHDSDRALAEFRQGLNLILDLSIVLPDRRVKPLLPDWSILNDSPRPLRLRNLMYVLKERIEQELGEYPDQTLLFELGDDAPEDVRKIFDRLSQSEPRLTYVVLPNKN
jgi:hypothetical protein